VSATTHLLQETMLFTGTVAEILRMSPHPFCCLEPDWSERIERVVDGAERALAGEV
jgi:hypothetical protein